MRRGYIGLFGDQWRFRFSRSGYDVDTATQAQLAIDERVFYGQIYAVGYVANIQPTVTHTAIVHFPALGFVPLCICFNRFAGNTIYPAHDKYKIGGGTFYYPSTSYTPADGSLTLYFGANTEVEGNYYLIFRRQI